MDDQPYENAMKLTIEDLETLTIHHGGHKSPGEGHCLLEVVSMFAGEQFSDSPKCVDPILAQFGRSWNDGMRSDEDRAQLKIYITRLPGTNKGPELSQKRGWMAMDWIVRTYCAAWLALNPRLAHHADALKALPPITCVADLQAAQPKLDAAKKGAATARDAARDAAWEAARDAAWEAAGAAAWAASGAAAGDAAGAAAGDAAWDAAWVAAWDAAGVAAWAAAWSAARAKLEPTVKQLQASAHELFSRMIDAE